MIGNVYKEQKLASTVYGIVRSYFNSFGLEMFYAAVYLLVSENFQNFWIFRVRNFFEVKILIMIFAKNKFNAN